MSRLLSLGPDLLAKAAPDRFPEGAVQAVGFRPRVWDAVRLGERAVPGGGRGRDRHAGRLPAAWRAAGHSRATERRAAREVAVRRALRQAMPRTATHISSAAKLLGISRPTLYDLIKQYRLQA